MDIFYLLVIYISFFVSSSPLCVLLMNLCELFMSRTLYFIDSRHAFFRFLYPWHWDISDNQLHLYNWQSFFFLSGTEYNRAFNNRWHLCQWNMTLTVCQPFSFQIVFQVIVWLSFLFCSYVFLLYFQFQVHLSVSIIL